MPSDDEDLVFKALADPTRRQLLDRLLERDGLTLTDLEATVPELTRFGVMKHLAVLEQAGLVVTRKEGRHKHHFLNAVPMRLSYERWIDKYRDRRAAALLDLKDHLEGTAMTTVTHTPTQVYQVYIRAGQQQVWDAITTPEIVARFFHGIQDEWAHEAGAHIRTWAPDHSKMWSDNTVLEYDPPRKLVHTWRSLYDPEMAEEPESRVTWEVEPQPGGISKLTLIHDRLDQSPKTAANVKGWSYYMSNLKTILETGESLPRVM